jgi:hypothetical protein
MDCLLDPPRFEKATRIDLAFSIAMAVCSVGIFVYFKVRNSEEQQMVRRFVQIHGDDTGVGGWTRSQRASDSETAILASSSQRRP